jgi:hypothetical protein
MLSIRMCFSSLFRLVRPGSSAIGLFLVVSAAPAQFLPSRWISDASRPLVTAMIGADLDGDGIQDALFNSTGTLDYLPGATPTMPQPYVPIGSGVASLGMLAADMDLDGDKDVVVLNVPGTSCAIFENLGQGQLWNKRLAGSGLAGFYGLMDADGDDDQDVLVQVGTGPAVMINQGAFNFAAPVQVETAFSTVLVWDPDNNGVDDLMMFRSNTVYHYANNGTGTFAAPVTLLSGVTSLPMLEDMDADGDLDLLVLTTSAVTYYPRTGPTQFGALVSIMAVAYTSGSPGRNVLDIDDDGDRDLVLGRPTLMGVSYLRNNGSGSYSWTGEAPNHLHGNGQYMLMMDMDLDQDKDMLFISPEGHVQWQEHVGTAGFDTQPVYSGSSLNTTPVHADLNGDGWMDVIVRTGISAPYTYSWCRNTGAGVFAAPVTLAQTGTDNDHFADADGDGDADLFTWTNAGGTTTVIWKPNTGNGVFGAAVTIFSGAGNLPIDLVDDLEGDGDVDVLLYISSSLHRFYLNTGTGTFISSSLTIATSRGFQRLLDADGDGDKDACYATQIDNVQSFSHGIARNNSGTSFTVVSGTINTFQNSYTFGDGAFLDVDRDGLKDVVYHSLLNSGGTIHSLVWVKQTAAGFESQTRALYTSTASVTSGSGVHRTGDVDNDGDDDLLVGPWLAINAGAGVFLSLQQLGSETESTITTVPGDLNNDGLTDLTIWSWSPEVRWLQFQPGSGRAGASHVLFENKPGTLKELVDFDLDGDMDVLCTTKWYANDGTGVFQERPIGYLYAPLYDSQGFVAQVAVDLDGDLDLDLVVGDEQLNLVAWMERLTPGSFSPPRAIAPATTGKAVSAADLDGDGDKDIMVKPPTSGSSSKWLRNMGGGTFQVVSMGTAYYADKFGDYDQDGDLDMIGYYQDVSSWYFALLKNNGSGVFTVATSYSNNFYRPAGTFADIDGDADLDHVYCQQGCYWSANDGVGNISAAHTTVAVAGGNFFSIECTDADADGDRDVYCMGFQNFQRVNNGNGSTFGAQYNATPPSGASFTGQSLAADMNGNGKLDVAGDGGGRVWIALATGTSCPIAVSAFLEGPYQSATGYCKDALRQGSSFPLTEPYTALGFAHVGGGGGEAIAAERLHVTGPNALVDWVVLELRDATTPTTRIATRSALLQRDGGIVDIDGISPVLFDVPAGNYRVAVKHRNHLGMMTASDVALSSTVTSVDFSSPATTTYGTNAQKQVGTKMVMWAGDATGNGTLKYTGSGNDRDPILTAVGSTTPNNTVSNIYERRDTNLDGVIKYTGTGNDRDIILSNVGSTTPNNTRTQQLP